MATPPPITVNASTTLVQVDTSASLGPYIVLLSNLNLPGSMITVRDSTGNASVTNTIILSTVNNIKFLNGGGNNNNIYTINQRYGFLTVTPKTSSIWGVVNTFAFPAESQTANLFQVNVSTLNVSSIATIQSLLVSTSAISTICTNNLFVQGNIVYDQSTIGNVAYYTSTIYAQGDITTKTNLYVGSTLSTTFVNASSTIYAPFISTLNINMGGVLNTNSTISTAGPLFVGSSISTTGDLAVGASTFIQGQLLAGSISTLGNMNIAGGLSVMSSIYTQGALFTQSSITAVSSISTLSHVNMGGSLSTLGNAFIGKELYVTSSILATGSISSLENVNVAGAISTGSNVYVGGSLFVVGSMAINNINACTINVLNSFSTISSMAAGGSFNVGGSTIMQGNVSAMSNFNIMGLLSTTSSIVGGDSLIIAKNGFFGSTVSTASLGVSSLYANTAFISTLSTVGQASFYSSMQIQGSASIFSSLAVACNVDVGRTLTTSNLQITGSTFISTLAVTNTVGFALNISSSTLHYGLFSTSGAMNIGGLISTTNALTVGSTIDTQYLNVRTGMSVFSNASFTQDIFALSSLFVGLSTVMIGNVTASTNMSTLGVANFGSSINILGSTTGTMAVFQNSLITPTIFNSTLQTSSITASTIAAINISTNSETSVSSLIQTLYAPRIFNSTLTTSSITASTIAAINTSTNSLAAISTITQTLYAPTIFNSSIQTSSITASTIAAINTSTNSLIAISSLTQTAFATNIFNSTLQTSSITASTIRSINETANQITAISTLTQTAFATNIFNSTLQTSSITASTITTINETANQITAISTLTQTAFATNIFNSTLQTSSITASTIRSINETANQITAISTLTQTAFATNIFNSTLQTSSITASTITTINETANQITAISTLTQTAFATNIFNSTLQTSSIIASTLGVANLNVNQITAISSLTQTAHITNIFNSSIQTSSIITSTLRAINEITNQTTTISSLTQTVFATNIFNSSIQTSSITASTMVAINMSTIGTAAFYSSVQVQGSLSVFSSIATTNLNFSGGLYSNGVLFTGGSGSPTFSTLSSVGQASFYSSVQIQGGLSVFSTITAYNINFTCSITSNGLPFSGGGGGTLSATSSFAQIAPSQLPLTSSVGVCFDPSGNMYVGDYNNYVIYKITPQGVISLFAGTYGVSGFVDGIGSAALFTTIWQPYYDPYTGTLLVPTSGSIRSINLTTRQVTTVIGALTLGNANSAASGSAVVCFGYLPSICGDGSGNYYVTDGAYNCIKKIIIPQVVTQYCGSMTLVCGSTAGVTGYYNGTGTAARFNIVRMLTINAAKTFLYLADTGNNVIRAISLPTYAVTTLAGATSGSGWSATTIGNTTAAPSGSTDSTTATSVRFNGPHGICMESNNVLVVEAGGNRLRLISSSYTATLAGSTAGTLAGVGANSQMSSPGSVVLDPTGSPWIVTYGSPAIFNYNLLTGYLNLYFQASATIPTPFSLQNTPISTVMVPAMATTAIFGSGFTTFNSAVTYVSPQGLLMDSQNNLYVSDKFKIRKVAPSGFVTSLFGDPSNIQDSNQPFPGAKGQYNGAYQMCFDNSGNMYIADAGVSTIHIVNVNTGAVTNLSITGQALNNCVGILFNAGTLYVSNTNMLASPPAGYLVSINISTGVSTLIAGSTTLGALTNGTGTAARFNFIYGICFDVAKANIFICDRGNTAIRQYNISTGAVTTFSTGVALPSYIAADSVGNYYATSGSTLYEINSAGTAVTFSSGFSDIFGITLDSYNNIYVADVTNNCIYFINPAGALSLYSGVPGATGTQDSVYASTLSLLTPYVGINKSNAQYTLDIAGSVNFSGSLYNNGFPFTSGSSSSTLSTLSTIGQAAFYSSVQIQGSVSIFSTLTAYTINFTSSITSNGLPFTSGVSATSGFAQVALPLTSSRGICFDPSGNTYVFNTGNSVIYKITPQGQTSLFAGTPGLSGWLDGSGSTALLNTNSGQLCYDSYTNCIAVADTTAVRLITLAGNVITMAGNASTGNAITPVTGAIFNRLTGICSDGSGNLYIVDANNQNIKKITLNSSTPTQYGCTVANVAGSLSGGAGYTNATGASALFSSPFQIAINSAKTFLYVPELGNHVIRSISLPGYVVGTLAGALTSPTIGSTDSTTPTSVKFNYPIGITTDASGVFVADNGNNSIRYINLSPFYTITLAGQIANTGNSSGVGANAQIYQAIGITLDTYGNPWMATTNGFIFNYNMATGYLNLFYTPTQTITSPANIQNTAASTIVVSAMAAATLYGSGFTAFNTGISYISPQGLIMDSQNNLYVSDKFKVRKVAPSGFVTSIFGDPSNIQNNNLPFPGVEGQYNGSYQMCFDNSGNLYIADAGVSTIHVVSATGVTNLAPTGQALNNCFGVLFNNGILYVSNTNILVSPPAGYLVAINLSTGVSTLIAGSTTLGALINGTGTAARFNYIYGMCFDIAKANILICDRGNTAIRNYNISTGAVTTYSVGVAFPSFIAADTLGNYYATSGTTLYKIVAGTATSFSSGFAYVLGVTVDSFNNIYVSDIVNNCIYFINSAGTLSVYSGTAGASGTQDSLYASTLSIVAPYVGINKSNAQYTLDISGSVNFSGGLFNNGVVISGGSISTFSTLSVALSLNTSSINTSSINAGLVNASTVVSQNLTATSGFAKISAGQLPLLNSRGLCFDGSGNMFVSDTAKRVIFKITPQGVVSLFAGNYGISGHIDGIGSAVSFGEIWQMCFDSFSGWIMICTVPVIRAMNPATGQVITLCGNPAVQGNSPGTGTAASFQAPLGVCSGGAGNLYIADGNANNICRVSFSLPITANTGTKLIIAGPTAVPFGSSGYYNNATGTSATFNSPRAIVVNSFKTLLWVVDHANQVIRQVSLTPPYAVTTFAGAVGSSGTPGNTTAATVGHTDSTTPGSVQFYGPHGIAIDASNNLYIAEYIFCFLRYINTNTFFTLSLAGDNGNINTEGVGANGQMAGPTAVALDSTGSPWIVAYNIPAIFNYNVKTGYLSIYWRPAGGNAFSAYSVQNTAVSTIAMPGITTPNIYGSGFTTFNQAVTYAFPAGVQMDSQNNLYVTDSCKIRKVTPSGFVMSIYGDPSNTQSNNLPGTGVLSEMGNSYQMCFDTSGNMFFADTNLHYIYRLNLATQTAIALPISAPTTGLANQGLCMWTPIGIVYNNNTLYVANRGYTGPYINTVNLLTNVITLIAGTPGSAAGDVDNATGTSAKFNSPTGICFDASKNNIFVCDSSNNKIRVVNLSGSYAVTTLTPTSGTITLNSPIYIVMDSLYNLYVTNYTAPIAIIKIPYGGTYPTQTITYGPSSSFAAGFGSIQGITVDSYNYVYVADTTNKLIYRISPTGSTDIYSGLYLVSGTQDSKYASSISLMAPYVGVGTSNPQVALQVVGSNVITPGLYMPTIYPDVFLSLLNYCPYATSARTMMEIGSTHTGTGGYGATYKYLLGYSNSAAGVGSYIIQSVSTTNPSIGYNVTGTPVTLLTLNNTGLTVTGATTITGPGSYGTLKLNTTDTESGVFIRDPGASDNTGWVLGTSPNFGSSPSTTCVLARFNANNVGTCFYFASNGLATFPTMTVNGKVNVVGTQLTDGLNAIYSDVFVSVLTSVGSTTGNRSMIEIGATNTTTGNFGSPYKYLMGFSNVPNGPGGNFIIQSVYSSGSYNNSATTTLFTLNNAGATFAGTVTITSFTTTSASGNVRLYYGFGQPQPVDTTNPGNLGLIVSGNAWVQGSFLMVSSDQRIKKNIRTVTDSLDIVNKLNIVSYDTIEYDRPSVKHGVIAQDIQKFYPEAVGVQRGFIPSVYNLATYELSGNVIITSPVTTGFAVNDKIRLLINTDSKADTPDYVYETIVIDILSDTQFTVAPWANFELGKDMLIYGKEVDDFLTVDKQQIGILAAGACQTLSGQVTTQSSTITSLQTDSLTQFSTITSLQTDSLTQASTIAGLQGNQDAQASTIAGLQTTIAEILAKI